MSGILSAPIFEDPPPPVIRTRGGRRISSWWSVLVPLMATPGRWARVAEYRDDTTARFTTSHLRCGGSHRPPGEWEFARRGLRVYARFVRQEANL